MLLPRVKGIYHVGCTDYPDPTYPWPCRWGSWPCANAVHSVL